jgi:hypothetical protein
VQTERLLVWLVGLVAIAASVLAYAVPVEALLAEVEVEILIWSLGGLVALPFLVVYGRALLGRVVGGGRRGGRGGSGGRGWT